MKHKHAYPEDIMSICKFAKALSHPARVHIIRKLSKMNSCCYNGDLAKELKISPSTLSQHLKELKYADLIQGELEAPYIKYCLNKSSWAKVKEMYTGLFDVATDHQKCGSSDDKQI